MAEKKVSVRLVAEGGQSVRAEFEGVGSAGQQAYQKIGASQKSAADSAKVFTSAIDKQERELNQLRAAINPAVAAQQRYDAALKTLNSSRQLGIINEAQYSAELEHVGRAYLTAGRNAQVFGTSQRVGAMQTANITAQFNDIGVMMASGQNPFQLAIQQGTQLNQVFATMGGPRGVLKGVVSGIASMISPMSILTIGLIAGGASLVSWGRAALAAKEDAKVFEDALKSIGEETTELQDKLELSRTGMKSIAELNVNREIDRLKSERAALLAKVATVGDAVEGERSNTFFANQVNQEIAALTAKLEKLERIRKEVREEEYAVNRLAMAHKVYAESRLEADRQQVAAYQRAMAFYAQSRVESDAQARSARQIITDLQAQADMAALVAVYGADSMEVAEARARAERKTFLEMVATLDVADSLKTEMIAAFDTAQDMSLLDVGRGIASAASSAQSLADWLNVSLSKALELQALTPEMADEDRAMAVQVVPDGSTRERNRRALDNFERLTAPPRRRSSSGGRGMSDAERAAQEAAREAERIYEATRTEAERYATSLKRLNELHRDGHLDTETFNRAVADLNDTFREAGTEILEQGIDGVSDALARALVYGEDLRDGLRSVFQGIAYDLLNSGIRDALSSIFGGSQSGGGLFSGLASLLGGAISGGIGGGGLPSYDGGGHTGNGPRSGGLDGRGGFLGVLHPNERVIDETRGSPEGGRVEIIVRNEPGTVVEIARNEARAAVSTGLSSWSRDGAPRRQAQIARDPRVRG